MKRVLLFLLSFTFISTIYSQAYWIYLQGNENYEGTDSIPPNYDNAYWLYKKSAQMGCPMAANKLGLCYYLGNGVEQSMRKSFVWTRKSARKGYPKAQYELGIMYLSGEGCHINSVLGYKWISRAADRGDTVAIAYLQQFSLYTRMKYTFDN